MQSSRSDTGAQQYWHAISAIKGVRVRKLLEFVERCGSAEAAFFIARERSRLCEFFSRREIENIGRALADYDQALFFPLARSREFSIVTYGEPCYPELLRRIESPPLLLYVKGDLTGEDNRSIAVVGARSATAYGKESARRFAADLCGLGFTVVSGLARGIDTWAHRGAMEAGGRTIAVLGCGIDSVYPAENRALSVQIAKQGAVISEFPPGTSALRQNFPMRNRIIAGMTLGTLVVEAGEKSGSLITAGMALDSGREVFAVPGPITSLLSKGAHRLIKEGATLADDAADIAESLWINGHTAADRKAPACAGMESFTEDDKALLKLIDDDGKTAAALADLSGVEPGRAMASLSLLELRGFIRRGAENLIYRSEKMKSVDFSREE
jgi:DNA processing protein